MTGTRECPACAGAGYLGPERAKDGIHERCERCGGTGRVPPAAAGNNVDHSSWRVLTPEQLAAVNARLAQQGARMAQLPTQPSACMMCGTKTAHTPDWTLWPWADGSWLCSRCNDARLETEEYP
jgi:hypothetical protein